METFWPLIAAARSAVPDPTDCCAVATAATRLLAGAPPAQIVATQQTLWDLLALSYRNPLWAAAYLMNGGCSDDGFDYFRGWLLLQGEEVFTAAVASPDTLATLPAVVSAAESGLEFECEAALSIAWDAHLAATGMKLPEDAFTIRYPELDPDWDFAFDDEAEMGRRLPRLAALYDV
ncbi:uncharacterized protein DUF4240 [Lentzea atacamensis]|uniref:Uncharacterized protein DUF4240 n=2 Tax=Lentzea TaxID=165301 RepID=A0A316I6W7_9PSEU|nr:DUF4240 domain-containing protein [Lentzea atacamensis]PWK82951.1 uncharacterized protein DUF4240 [Lentzea atacamensis]RAS62410.1 uncharacterized protein DUF4240 [Lentzea atacamensis]